MPANGGALHLPRFVAGNITVYDMYGSEGSNLDTLSCAHCGKHWTVRIGSGVQRGACTRCKTPSGAHAPLCGAGDCFDYCDPVEKKLERIEAGGLWAPSAPVPAFLPAKLWPVRA